MVWTGTDKNYGILNPCSGVGHWGRSRGGSRNGGRSKVGTEEETGEKEQAMSVFTDLIWSVVGDETTVPMVGPGWDGTGPRLEFLKGRRTTVDPDRRRTIVSLGGNL